jgi:hypothetical protein
MLAAVVRRLANSLKCDEDHELVNLTLLDLRLARSRRFIADRVKTL